MNIQGEILIIDDDKDDLLTYRSIFNEINILNPVKYFEYPTDAYNYLEQIRNDPLLIISDINMPSFNGFEFREKILQNEFLKGRNSPFVYITNSGNDIDIFKAHELFATGLYKKRIDYNSQKSLIIDIMKSSIEMYKFNDVNLVM